MDCHKGSAADDEGEFEIEPNHKLKLEFETDGNDEPEVAA